MTPPAPGAGSAAAPAAGRRGALLGAGVAIAAGAAGLAAAWWRGVAPPPAGAGDPAAEQHFWPLVLPTPDGGALAMASFRGRPLVLNFWATWCPPCVTELPELDRFQREQAATGLRVVGLAIDGPTPVREFLAKRPLGFPVALAGFEGTAVAKALGNTGGALPFTVMFDAAGHIVQRKLGATSFDELMGWRSGKPAVK
jgi:thiol-disulfide isomerase/thioredoxin